MYHDTLTGDNSVPGVTGFIAGTGYDEATGWGSVDAASLVNFWNSNATPDFTLAATPASQSVNQGVTANYTVALTAIGGFANAVTFSISGLPANATATFSPASLSGSGSSALAISTAITTPTGSYPLIITGTDGVLTHTASVTLVVTTPDFTLSAAPASQTVATGGSTSYTATIAPLNGYTGTVNFSVSGLPAGAGATFTPASVTTSGSSTTGREHHGWNYSGGQLSTDHYRERWRPYPHGGRDFVGDRFCPECYAVIANHRGWRFGHLHGHIDGNQWLHRRRQSQSHRIAPVCNCNLQSGKPHRLRFFNIDDYHRQQYPGSGLLTHSCSQRWHQHAQCAPDPGGRPSGRLRCIDIAGLAEREPGPERRLRESPSVLRADSDVVVLSVSGLPAGATATLSPSSITRSGVSSLSITTTPDTPGGSYTLTVTGTSGPLVRTTTATLVVLAPDFSLSASPASQSVPAGNASSYSVTLSPINNFVGIVNFSISGLPAGAGATFTPASLTSSGTSTLAVTTTAGTPGGSYTLTVTQDERPAGAHNHRHVSSIGA